MGEKGGLVVMVASPLKTRFDVEFGVYYVNLPCTVQPRP